MLCSTLKFYIKNYRITVAKLCDIYERTERIVATTIIYPLRLAAGS